MRLVRLNSTRARCGCGFSREFQFLQRAPTSFRRPFFFASERPPTAFIRIELWVDSAAACVPIFSFADETLRPPRFVSNQERQKNKATLGTEGHRGSRHTGVLLRIRDRFRGLG